MANFYPYLISSLPALIFGNNPPFSFERFLDICWEFIPEKDFMLLKALPQADRYQVQEKRRHILKEWIAFDTTLRNELAKVRAAHKQVDPQSYLRSDGYSGSSLAQVVLAAQKNPSLLEAERTLDLERWRALDEFLFGHYFDLDCLIVYAYKLLILQRWERIVTADKAGLLEKIQPAD
jgi:hypothetical protein